MIDLKNTYIENDNGEKLQAWFALANEQGLNPNGRDIDWFEHKYCFINGSGRADCLTHKDDFSDDKEITLADLKPKRTKVEYVKVEFPSIWEGVKAMETGGEVFYIDGEEGYVKIGNVPALMRPLVMKDNLYRKAEREVSWQEEARELLTPAARQYMHNDGSGLLCGYNRKAAEEIVAKLLYEMTDKPE